MGSPELHLLPVPGLLLLTPLMLTIIFMSTACNVLVLLSYKPHQLFVDAQSLYLLHLAVSDLLISIVCMPLHMVSTLWSSGWPLGRVMCQLYTAVQLTLLNVTTLMLVLVALDGLLLAEDGVRCTGLEARKKAYIWLGLCWFLAVAVHVPETLTWDILQGHSLVPNGVCLPAFYNNTGHVFFVQVWSFFLPVFVLSVINTKLYLRLRNLSRTILTFGHSFPSKPMSEKHIHQKEKHNPEKHGQVTVSDTSKVIGQVRIASEISIRLAGEFSKQEQECRSDASYILYNDSNKSPLKSVSMCSGRLSVRSLSTGQIGKLVSQTGKRSVRSRSVGRRSQSSNDVKDVQLQDMDLKNASEGRWATSIPEAHSASKDRDSSSTKAGCPASRSRDVSLETSYRLRRVAIILFTLVLILVLCWLPYSVAFLVRSVCQDCIHPFIYSLLVWVLYFKSCINPFLYAYNTFTFRSRFRRLLVRILHVKRLRRMTTDHVSNERASILN